MPLKRASRGRKKGGKGSSDRIQCSNCGATVPRDKAKKVTSRLNLVEHSLARELRAGGTYIASPTVLKWYCISCAIHFGILRLDPLILDVRLVDYDSQSFMLHAVATIL